MLPRDVLVCFFDDGRLLPTNSGAERAIKSVALGRALEAAKIIAASLLAAARPRCCGVA